MKFLFFILLFISSCRDLQQVDLLELALQQAGDNRKELEKVLALYDQDPGDSLKYKAVCFLISNMPYHYHYVGSQLENYKEQYELLARTKLTTTEIKDSIQRKYGLLTEDDFIFRKDIDYVDSAYLVNNVESAFKVWRQQPWGENVSFDDFCEYILPYKIADESLPVWRDTIYNNYIHLLDSVIDKPEAKDPLFVAQIVIDSISKAKHRFALKLTHVPHIGPVVLKWRSGSCREYADIVVYVLRALGIPCGVDFMQMRGDDNATHFWNFVPDKNGNTFYTDFPEPILKPASELKKPKVKVYRYTYSLNSEMQKSLLRQSDEIHSSFNLPKFIDVSTAYNGKYNRNLRLSADYLYNTLKDELYYLCVSVKRDWTPVAWGCVQKDSVFFENIEGGVIFRLATYKDKSLIIESDPFLVEKEEGNIRFFEASEQMDTLKLLSKFNLLYEKFIPRMCGGVFEGSNDPMFRIRDTLYVVTEIPDRLCTIVYPSKNKKYRYVRYKGPDHSYCNISEMTLYESQTDIKPLLGTPIGTPGCFQKDGSHEFTKAVDGDPYTSFDYVYPSGGWVGLDLGSPHSIDKIVYTPRNRDNFIRLGDTYELLYWVDKKWNSAGRQIANSDSLLYIVPNGALYYLRNHTRGNSERIFEYVNGKQVFW